MSYRIKQVGEFENLKKEIYSTVKDDFKPVFLEGLMAFLDEIDVLYTPKKSWHKILDENPDYRTKLRSLLKPEVARLGNLAIDGIVILTHGIYKRLLNTIDNESKEREMFSGKTLLESFLSE